MSIRAVLFDFGGVVTTSPFEAFTRYEREAGVPDGLLRRINSTDPDTNAWARYERNEIDLDTFIVDYEAEAAALGHRIEATKVLAGLRGAVRPKVVEAIGALRAAGLRTGCITNNMTAMQADGDRPSWADGLDLGELFEIVIESAKVGVRKPDPAIYTMATDALGVPPAETVFLDDLGINLKPARAMGMTTIKVLSEAQLLTDLAQATGVALTTT